MIHVFDTKEIVNRLESTLATMTDCGVACEDVFASVVAEFNRIGENEMWAIKSLADYHYVTMFKEYPAGAPGDIADMAILVEAITNLYKELQLLFLQYGLIEEVRQKGAQVVNWTGYNNKDATINIG